MLSNICWPYMYIFDRDEVPAGTTMRFTQVITYGTLDLYKALIVSHGPGCHSKSPGISF